MNLELSVQEKLEILASQIKQARASAFAQEMEVLSLEAQVPKRGTERQHQDNIEARRNVAHNALLGAKALEAVFCELEATLLPEVINGSGS